MTTQRARVSRRAILLAAAATAAGFGTSGKSAWAANANWSAAPPGSFWNAPNWDNGGPYTALPGDALFFGASSTTGLNNDFTTGTSFAGLTFNAGASAFTFDNNDIVLSAPLVVNSGGSTVETINFGITGAAGTGISMSSATSTTGNSLVLNQNVSLGTLAASGL